MKLLRNVLAHFIVAFGAMAIALLSFHAHAQDRAETFAVNLDFGEGACFSGQAGDYVSTRAISVEYEYDSADLNADAYLRDAPTGGDCGINGLTSIFNIERQWDLSEAWYALASFGASEVAVAQAYGNGDIGFTYVVDATPAYSGLVGIGRSFGEHFHAEIASNVIETEWYGGMNADKTMHLVNESRAAAVSFGYERPAFGGELDIEFTGLYGDERLLNYSIQWSRDIFQFGYRVTDGLANLANPFPLVNPANGHDQVPGTLPVVQAVEIGVRWTL